MDLFTANPLLIAQPSVQAGTEADYRCFDQYGQQVAHVYEEDMSAGMSVARYVIPQAAPRKVVVNDMYRRPLLVIEKYGMSSTTSVAWPDGRPVGTIEHKTKFAKSEFGLLDPWERRVGFIEGERWLKSNFVVFDDQDHEVARVNETKSPISTQFIPTNAFYVRRRYPTLPEPLNTLVVASGIVIDLVLHPDR